MNAAEAKTKWCPMVRVIMTPANTTWQGRAMTNRLDFVEPGQKEARCIGPDCMMWRQTVGDDGDCGLTIPGIINAEVKQR